MKLSEFEQKVNEATDKLISGVNALNKKFKKDNPDGYYIPEPKYVCPHCQGDLDSYIYREKVRTEFAKLFAKNNKIEPD